MAGAGWPSTRESLIDRVKTVGDDGSWDEFIAIYAPVIDGYLKRRGLQAADCDDLTADIIAGLLRKIAKHDKNKGRFRDWLRKVTDNRLKDWLRRRKRGEIGAGGDDPQIDEPTAEYYWTEAFYSGILRRALQILKQELNETDWRVFHETFTNERPCKAVAVEMGYSLSSIHKKRAAAVGRLKEIMFYLSEDWPIQP